MNLDKQQRMRVPKNIFRNQPKENTAGLFNMIHSKFTKLGHGYHGAPIQRFQYHMDDAKWISIEPIVMGKVVVSNTCPEVNDYSLFLQCYSINLQESTLLTFDLKFFIHFSSCIRGIDVLNKEKD